jgi:hypothetical protein
LREGAGARVVGEEVAEFVAEDGDAARFEADDGNAGGDLGFELIEDFFQQGFRAI